ALASAVARLSGLEWPDSAFRDSANAMLESCSCRRVASLFNSSESLGARVAFTVATAGPAGVTGLASRTGKTFLASPEIATGIGLTGGPPLGTEPFVTEAVGRSPGNRIPQNPTAGSVNSNST